MKDLCLKHNLHFMISEHFVINYSGQVPCQVFTKNGLKEVKYEKNRSVSILYPIDYQ
jgi:hypothetical protein